MQAAEPIPMPVFAGEALCVAYDGFFPEAYTVSAPEVQAATALCRRCPLVRICLLWALSNPALAEEGIWGATTPAQRRSLHRQLLHRLGEEGTARTLRAEYRKGTEKLSRRP